MRLIPCAALAAMLAACGGSADGTAVNATVAANVTVADSHAAKPLPSPSPTPSVTRAYLIGAWVDDLRGCDGDGGTVYKADGAWFEGDKDGTWALDGDRLTVTITETSEMGDNLRKIDPPEIVRWTLTRVGKNRLTYRGNGKSFSLVKCP